MISDGEINLDNSNGKFISFFDDDDVRYSVIINFGDTTTSGLKFSFEFELTLLNR